MGNPNELTRRSVLRYGAGMVAAVSAAQLGQGTALIRGRPWARSPS